MFSFADRLPLLPLSLPSLRQLMVLLGLVRFIAPLFRMAPQNLRLSWLEMMRFFRSADCMSEQRLMKDGLGAKAVQRMAESLKRTVPGFPKPQFIAEAMNGNGKPFGKAAFMLSEGKGP